MPGLSFPEGGRVSLMYSKFWPRKRKRPNSQHLSRTSVSPSMSLSILDCEPLLLMTQTISLALLAQHDILRWVLVLNLILARYVWLYHNILITLCNLMYITLNKIHSGIEEYGFSPLLSLQPYIIYINMAVQILTQISLYMTQQLNLLIS